MEELIDELLSRRPSLRGKEVATALGLDKSAVNAFLHNRRDKYQQDSNFCWSFAAQEAIVILPNGWTSSPEFERLLWKGTAGRQLREIKFEVENGCRLLFESIARLLAVSNQCAKQGLRVTLDFSEDLAIRSYLSRMAFFERLDPAVHVLPSRPTDSLAQRYQGNSDSLLEIEAVCNTEAGNAELCRQLLGKFIQNTDHRYEVAAGTIFSELINNVYEHSGACSTGFAGLQKYEGRVPHIQTIVSDLGVGIAASLRRTLETHYPEVFSRYGVGSISHDIALVRQAVVEGGLSEFGSGHGAGLHCSHARSAAFNARFEVRQERFCLSFEYINGNLARPTATFDVFPLRGTHICFDFKLV